MRWLTLGNSSSRMHPIMKINRSIGARHQRWLVEFLSFARIYELGFPTLNSTLFQNTSAVGRKAKYTYMPCRVYHLSVAFPFWGRGSTDKNNTLRYLTLRNWCTRLHPLMILERGFEASATDVYFGKFLFFARVYTLGFFSQ